jgi:hypothetical protein
MGKTYNRKFGCEFEFSTKFETLSELIHGIIPQIYGPDSILARNMFFKSVKNIRWHLKSDATTECELVTPISNYEDLGKIRKVLKKLNKHYIRITKHDSVHVHMDAEDISKRQIIAAWMQIEPIIMKCFPKHRHNNEYCIPLMKPNSSIAELFLEAEDDVANHHSILSLANYKNRGIVEFRICHGTIDPDFITGLVKFYMIFLRYAKSMDPIDMICGPPISDLDEIFRRMGIRCKLIKYALN